MKNPRHILVLTSLLAFLIPGSISADQTQIGEREYKSHCAGCHGPDGEGNGPFVEFLKTAPPSLTSLARNNQGVFPYTRIYEVINGTQSIAAHGTRDMPIWGERYASEIIRDVGEFGSEHPRTVRCRILELVFFLTTLQKP